MTSARRLAIGSAACSVWPPCPTRRCDRKRRCASSDSPKGTWTPVRRQKRSLHLGTRSPTCVGWLDSAQCSSMARVGMISPSFGSTGSRPIPARSATKRLSSRQTTRFGQCGSLYCGGGRGSNPHVTVRRGFAVPDGGSTGSRSTLTSQTKICSPMDGCTSYSGTGSGNSPHFCGAPDSGSTSRRSSLWPGSPSLPLIFPLVTGSPGTSLARA